VAIAEGSAYFGPEKMIVLPCGQSVSAACLLPAAALIEWRCLRRTWLDY
jgi:hypothetical protein